MGAHSARRTCTVGRAAGRGALTAATALALAGASTSVAFAGSYDSYDSYDSDRSYSDSDYERGYDKGYDKGYKKGYDKGYDDGRDSDHDRKHWKDRDHKHDRKHDRSGTYGARYDDSVHKGDNIYNVRNVTNTVPSGLLSGLL